MMKKRLVAFGLAGVMLLGMSMNVFAETTDIKGDGTSAQEKEIDVNYTVPVSYIIEIPSKLEYDSKGINNELSFSQRELVLGYQAQVIVSSSKVDYDLALGENAATTYSISLKSADGTAPVDNASIAVFGESNKEGKTIKVVGNTVAPNIAGTYTGKVDFTISYKPHTTE